MNLANVATAIEAPIDDVPVTAATKYSITIHVGPRSQVMSLRQAFAFAHGLVKRQKYGPAAAVLQRLCNVPVAEPAAAILLAICESGQSKYQAALDVLNHATFSDPLVSSE